MNVFGTTDGAFETAQSAGLIPTDPDGELSKNCKKMHTIATPVGRVSLLTDPQIVLQRLSMRNLLRRSVRILSPKHDICDICDL